MGERNLSLSDILVKQAQLHPSMKPQDVMKLCFQAAFGAEHLIEDFQAAKAYFEQEFAMVEAKEGPIHEQISPTIYRINIAAWKKHGIPQEWLFRMFALTVNLSEAVKAKKVFLDSLEQVKTILAKAQVSFSVGDWLAYKEAYLREGIRPVRHSETYRNAEKPAYRIVSGKFMRLLPLLKKLASLDRRQETHVIAIDGRSASGKTTIATQLENIIDAGLIHMDDFFLPQPLRTPDRLAEAGGNIHYERFSTEVLPCLSSGAEFRYQKFDCAKMTLGDFNHVRKSKWRIVEGAYSCHPRFGNYMDLKVFSDISKDEQLSNIKQRETEKSAKVYVTRWIPMEEAYIKKYQVLEQADLVL